MPEFHADAIEGQLVNNPGIKVVVPSTPHDAKGLLLPAIRDPDPVVFIEHQRLYRNVRGDVPSGDYTVPLGDAAVRREGGDLTFVSWGAGVLLADQAAAELGAQGISAGVLDLRTLAPLDVETLVAAWPRPACASSSRKGRSRPGSQRRSSRPCSRRPSSRSTDRCCASAATTRRTRPAGSRTGTCLRSSVCSRQPAG
jgi:pyruvate dehydrogenase E1 component subunit beta